MSKKPTTLFSVATLLMASFGLLQAQTVSTDPVGYVTLTINGSPDGTTPAFTALSVGMQNAAVVTGSIASDATSAVLTDSNASNTTNAYAATDAAGNGSYFLQITSGANEGLICDILSNDATTYTTGTDLTGIVSAGDTYVIKAHVTLADIFGAANSVGFRSGGDSLSSDLVFIMSTDGVGSYSTYYYQTDDFGFLGGNGWRVVGDSNTDMSNVVVGPDDGIMISRSATGNLNTVVSGNVNTVDHKRTLPNGLSLVSYPFPVAVTLDDSGIFDANNGYVTDGDSLSSDIVYVISSSGTFSSYYYQTDNFGFLGGTGWRAVGDANTDVGSTEITAGSSVVVLHRGSGLTWSDAVPFTL